MAEEFALSQNIQDAHDTMTRSICTVDAGRFVTVSYDCMMKTWQPDGLAPNLYVGREYAPHIGHVMACCRIPACDSYPQGAVATAAKEEVYVWNAAASPEPQAPLAVLKSHTGVVSALAASADGLIVSGAWDKTARVWRGGVEVACLPHAQQVLCAACLATGAIVTGSSDRTIYVWTPQADGSYTTTATLTGHSDAVRAVVPLPGSMLLSAANDGTVRQWALSGECLQSVEASPLLIYALCVLPTGEWCTGGEDRTLRIFRDGACVQSIPHPSVIWSLACLESGDLVAGCDDGGLRIWTRNAERRITDERVLEAFAESTLSGKVGGIEVGKLPTEAALHQPGERPGQQLIIRRGLIPEVHVWSGTKWDYVGQVVEGPGAATEGDGLTPPKMELDGKVYDVIFPVELSNGTKYQIAFNLDDQPYTVAQEFLWKHHLSQDFLMQIADFVRQQKEVYLERLSLARAGQLGPPTEQPPKPVNVFTPDTPPAAMPAPAAAPAEEEECAYFPSVCVPFEGGNFEMMVKKIAEFNARVDERWQLTPAELAQLRSLAASLKVSTSCRVTAAQYAALHRKILHWPHDLVFPGLDLLRAAAASTALTRRYSDDAAFSTYILPVLLLRGLSDDSTVACRMLVLRWLANLLASPHSAPLLLAQAEQILDSAAGCLSANKPHVLISLATMLFNFSVHFAKDPECTSELKLACMSVLKELLDEEKTSDVTLRSLHALRLLIQGDEVARALAMEELDFQSNLSALSSSTHRDARLCAKALLAAP
eukprot:gnl/Trimastix_PCT/1788.p1 GENE.gnl/Trimastix_PCT/1788~~gnl/Trimastix_PCT/1788.p1  ORF type:complete len:787 (-),score=239.01 gnl/Trimastix_PCT/1788:55-2361(-)